TVKSTVGFSVDDEVHIGTEAMLVETVTSATVLRVFRQRWMTTLQKHFAGDGDRLSYAIVTNRPRSLEGRVWFLYAYGEGDDPQGNGTLITRGIVATEPQASNPTTWTITLDPITRCLDQPFGADLG